MTRESAGPAAALLKVLRDAHGELRSSRELKEALGGSWREALQELKDSGYQIDEVIGSGNKHSFRLSDAQPGFQYLTEPSPNPRPSVYPGSDATQRTTQITLTAEEIKALLRGDTPPTVRDALVGGLIRLTGGD